MDKIDRKKTVYEGDRISFLMQGKYKAGLPVSLRLHFDKLQDGHGIVKFDRAGTVLPTGVELGGREGYERMLDGIDVAYIEGHNGLSLKFEGDEMPIFGIEKVHPAEGAELYFHVLPVELGGDGEIVSNETIFHE
ncbi:MAG: hypothetical protein UU48_C0016G0005 [Candidatus Uhrbacteria bacterium GW2011_GWF2_41_16]|uniref:Uncharacterized protein n=2 Tax=Candidatus Uhriibacteriota TaxID=1752732 RepID=A0A0G0XKV7_9BACT|nr:MAG: hypothetical protein UU35_C0018G0006 [Candidatus Uhrbacteria bacterium GW2011_GWC2_41_11]KKR97405.1 MAG: hypothetical protein UU48_C0016G0005 [Candidatus Uhrbacteria bacterium GW2011_GWF2_41_16]HBP00576.1 hypothetical protein [Candidatus Uhrbacteria bacterium]